MWCGVVWCGVVWCGVVWCGVVWCGVVWCGVVWCGVVWCGAVIGREFLKKVVGTTDSQCTYINKGFLRFNTRENFRVRKVTSDS